jgi:hypothetical protein
MALQAPSGAGKTYSALLLAKGLANGDFSKVAIIDTENGSADLYSHLGDYNVLTLENPFSPERYIEAISTCEKANIEVIIIDSISQCWEFLLNCHSSMQGNSFTNWSKITPRQQNFIYRILESNCHMIVTMRTKQNYVLNQKDGKYVPEKVGLKAVQRDGIDYEFTLVFDIDMKHHAMASKDRTGLFIGRPEFIINSATGRKILEWCDSDMTQEELKAKVEACLTIQELTKLYNFHGVLAKSIEQDFVRKQNLLNSLISPNDNAKNGIMNSYQKS